MVRLVCRLTKENCSQLWIFAATMSQSFGKGVKIRELLFTVLEKHSAVVQSTWLRGYPFASHRLAKQNMHSWALGWNTGDIVPRYGVLFRPVILLDRPNAGRCQHGAEEQKFSQSYEVEVLIHTAGTVLLCSHGTSSGLSPVGSISYMFRTCLWLVPTLSSDSHFIWFLLTDSVYRNSPLKQPIPVMLFAHRCWAYEYWKCFRLTSFLPRLCSETPDTTFITYLNELCRSETGI
jgi:hypothetical protein